MAGKAGYEYLLAYKLSVPIYDYTVVFCRTLLTSSGIYAPYTRTRDQMEQAARSGMSVIVEGNQQESLAGYIKMLGVSRGSYEELLKDYLAFARHGKIEIWEKERVIGEVGEIGEIWGIIRKTPTLPDFPDFPNLPDNPERAVNLMITLVHQENYLLDGLIASLKKKHEREGGFSEKLLQKRLEYRKRR